MAACWPPRPGAARARRLDGARPGCPATFEPCCTRSRTRSTLGSPQRRRGRGVHRRDRLPGSRAPRALAWCGLVLGLSIARPLAAQEQSVVEQLAPVLAAEDARDFQSDLFRRALVAPDSLVRRIAALGAGPDRRLQGHAARRAAPRRSRHHGAGGGGVRPGPAPGHGRDSAPGRPVDRPPGARCHHRGRGRDRAGEDRRAAER